MKKILKIIWIFLIVCILWLFVYLKNKQFVPKNYENTVETWWEIEKKYLQKGYYEVAKKEFPLLQNFWKFVIYYPSDLENSNKKFPLVVMSNWSWVVASKYENLFKHLASWGFVVIWTDEKYAWNWFSSEMSIRFLKDIDKKEFLGENNEKNIFYNKIDFEKVGISWHSQWWVWVFNAITTYKNSSIYKASVALSPTNMELAKNLYWDYDVSEIKIPILLLTSSEWDVFSSVENLKATYEKIPKETMKIIATRNKANHGEMLYFSDWYVTAWFMYFLQNDENAKKAFFGENPEIFKNKLYKNQEKNLIENNLKNN